MRLALPEAISLLFTQSAEHLILKGLDQLLHWAVVEHISDLHIEPLGQRVRIRVRVDGTLQEIVSLPSRYASTLLSKMKMLAHLDIAEKRLPQDGRFELHQAEGVVNGRISTCPTLYGEKAVLRLLALPETVLDLIELGMSAKQLEAVEKLIQSPHGLVIVTGPTGSGKTMTLYALLARLNTPEQNLISIEDPIEMVLPGLNQVQIQEKAGIEFKTLLRHLLRQDPDILMIGEIRDSETAEIAIKAAQTGHLVLSTLHTQSAAQALSRLQQLGIPPYLVMETTRLVIAQRLVCRQGARGRIGIFEMLQLDAALEAKLQQGQSPERSDYIDGLDLHQAGRLKIAAGLTSLEALQRVI